MQASLATWLTRIAHNRAVNLLRSAAHARRTELPREWGSAGAEDPYDRVAASDVMLRLYARLRPDERELLNFRYVMELRDREVGALLGLPEKTVNKRYQRLLGKCRSLLNGPEKEC